jgi:hypothetical protein
MGESCPGRHDGDEARATKDTTTNRGHEGYERPRRSRRSGHEDHEGHEDHDRATKDTKITKIGPRRSRRSRRSGHEGHEDHDNSGDTKVTILPRRTRRLRRSRSCHEERHGLARCLAVHAPSVPLCLGLRHCSGRPERDRPARESKDRVSPGERLSLEVGEAAPRALSEQWPMTCTHPLCRCVSSGQRESLTFEAGHDGHVDDDHAATGR